MATNTTLSAQPRAEYGKSAARKLRATGRVPAVVYGHGEPTRELSVDAHELERLFAKVHYENTVLTLQIDGEAAPVKALVREVQRHAYRDIVLHVDFHQIHADEKVHVSVPVRLVGAAPGVKAGGLLQHTLTDIEVQCLPDDIPDHFDVDVSGLDIGDSIHVSDIAVPEGVTFLEDAERSVCSVIPPTVVAATEDDLEAAEAADAAEAEPEVIGREREDEEEAGD